jgi:hypothetical protein
VRLADPLDQASGLRRLFAPEPCFQTLGVLGPEPRRTADACAGLALSLGRRGHRVLVMDEMRPPNNVAGLLGVMPRHGLADAASRGLLAVMRQATEGLVLLAAQDGPKVLAGWSEHDLLDMTEEWRARADAPEWLLLNGGDGAARGHSLAGTASLRVLVLPGNRAALADAYAAMKTAHAAWSGNNWLVLVVGAEAGAAFNLFSALSETAQRFLALTPRYLGCVAPFAPGAAPEALDTQQIDLLNDIVGRQADSERISFEQYWQRMWLFSRMSLEAASDKSRHDRRSAGER